MRWRFFFSEAVHSIRGNVATTIAASITVLIVTFLLGVFATVFLFVRDRTETVRSDVTVKAFLPKGTESDPDTLNRIRNDLAALPYVKSIRYVSPEDAIAELSDEERAQLNVLAYNPLPPSFWLKLTNPDQVEQVSQGAMTVPEVKHCGQPPCVSYGEELTKRVLFVTKVILWTIGALMLLLGVAAVVLIANTIRLSIFARRREIEVMKLVGATNWFVRVPFVLEGMLTGLVGAAGAIALLSAAYVGLGRINQELAAPAGLFPGGAAGLGVALAAFGLLLGAFGSGMTLRRFLRV